MRAFSSWLPSLPPVSEAAGDVTLDIAALRTRTIAVLADCTGYQSDALRLRLQRARDARELWLARSDIYQLVARQHCETQAALRVNALLPSFAGHVPARMLAAV